MRALQKGMLATVIAAGLAIAAPDLAQAHEKFPTKPVRLIVGFSPGSSTDITARTVAPKLSALWAPEEYDQIIRKQIEIFTKVAGPPA